MIAFEFPEDDSLCSGNLQSGRLHRRSSARLNSSVRWLQKTRVVYTTKTEIIDACSQALALAPKEYPQDLPTTKELNGAPDWYRFEHAGWSIGEKIRQSFSKSPRLKRDTEILERVFQVVECVNLRRGRQSFVMALGFVAAKHYARPLSKFLSDPDVDGQVLDTLLKMKASGYSKAIEPLLTSKRAWIRNLAKRYVSRYI